MTSLSILVVLLLVTLSFAAINTAQEGHQLLQKGLILVLAAGVSQLPGLLVGVWRWRRASWASVPMLIGAHILGVTGAVIYGLTALQVEPADSVDSAAHMHVVMIPLLHCLLAIAVFAVCGLVSAGVILFQVVKRRQGNESS